MNKLPIDMLFLSAGAEFLRAAEKMFRESTARHIPSQLSTYLCFQPHQSVHHPFVNKDQSTLFLTPLLIFCDRGILVSQDRKAFVNGVLCSCPHVPPIYLIQRGSMQAFARALVSFPPFVILARPTDGGLWPMAHERGAVE